MKQSVRSQVLALEHRLQILIDKRTGASQISEATAKLNADIEQAQRELEHYRAALRFELEHLEDDDALKE